MLVIILPAQPSGPMEMNVIISLRGVGHEPGAMITFLITMEYPICTIINKKAVAYKISCLWVFKYFAKHVHLPNLQ